MRRSALARMRTSTRGRKPVFALLYVCQLLYTAVDLSARLSLYSQPTIRVQRGAIIIVLALVAYYTYYEISLYI